MSTSTASAVQPVALGRPSSADTALLALAVGAASLSGPLVAASDAPGLAVAFWRSAIAAVLIVPLAIGRRRDEIVRCVRGGSPAALVAGLMLALHFAVWMPSLALTSVAASTALVTTQPIWTAMMSTVSGRRLAPVAWLGIGCSVAGAVVITGVDVTASTRAFAGDVLALGGAVFCAAYLQAGAKARATLTTVSFIAVCYTVAAVVLLVLCLMGGVGLGGYPARTWVLIGALTAGPQLLGHSLLGHVVKSTGPTMVAMFVLFETPGAAFIALLWLGQRPTAWLLPGIALLVVGVAIVIRAANTPATAIDARV